MGLPPQATPTAIPPTASFTPPSTNTPEPTATLTPTPTPIPKIGTVYLDPDYDLNDRIKIIEANQEALWKYTTESFMMLNSYGTDGKGTDSYMKKLAESVGIDFEDKAALLEYIKTNDIPTEIDGVKFAFLAEGSGNLYLAVQSMANQGLPIKISHYSVQIIPYEDFVVWNIDNQDIIKQFVLLNGDIDNPVEISGGILPVTMGDHIEPEFLT